MNKCHFAGRLTRDPEIRYTQGERQIAVASYTLAVDRRFKTGGQAADFINLVGYDKAAEFAEKYLKKGIKMIVTARCQTRSYTNKDDRKVYVTEFVVEDQEFAESKKAASGPEPMPTDEEGFMKIPDDLDNEIPFI